LQTQIDGLRTLISGDTHKGGATAGIMKEIKELKKKFPSTLDEKMVDWGKQQAQAALDRVVELNKTVDELEKTKKAHAKRLFDIEKDLKPKVVERAKELFERAENLCKRITSIDELMVRIDNLEKQPAGGATTGRTRSNSSPTPLETPPGTPSSERKNTSETTKKSGTKAAKKAKKQKNKPY